jgi:hypothetical protein
VHYFYQHFLSSIYVKSIFISPRRFYRIDQVHWKNKILFPKGDKNKKASMDPLYHGKSPTEPYVVRRVCKSKDEQRFIPVEAHGAGGPLRWPLAKTENSQEIGCFPFFFHPRMAEKLIYKDGLYYRRWFARLLS